HADDLTNHADIIRMTKKTVRSGANERRSGHDNDAERPAVAERGDCPVLDRLREDEHDRAGDEPSGLRAAAGEAFGEHRDKRGRIRDPHQRIYIVLRLDAAAGAETRFVTIRPYSLNQHRDKNSGS